MTEKRYSLVYYADKGGAFIKDNENGIEWYHDSRASLLEIVNELNELDEKNKEIKTQYDNLKAQRDEFYRGARENANHVGQLEKENEELKQQLDSLQTKKNLSSIHTHKKITGLMEANKELKQSISDWQGSYDELYEDNLKLEKENKELRSERDYWKTLAQSLAKTNGNVELKDEHLAWKRVDVE